MDRDTEDVGAKDLKLAFGVVGSMAALAIILGIVTNL
jgi:hypothetical protein